ncbi:MAG TPA: hypothetical protein VMD28_02335 [Acidimicrobiales bacterium]|nr:hypothetical protein [Acidimicrobiales bacterium]
MTASPRGAHEVASHDALDVALATTWAVADPDLPVLVEALARVGLRAGGVAWDDPGFDWTAPQLSVVRSTWDYAARPEAFLEWARGVPRLANPHDVLAWSCDKRYLAELANAGIPVVETSYASSGSEAVLPEGDVVVKPVIGAGSRGARRFAPDEHDAARSHVDELAATVGLALVQPYEPAAELGEVDVVVLDGVVSHAIRKHAPMGIAPDALPQGPLRVEVTVPTAEVLALVDDVLGAVPGEPPLCYARVDVVETARGPLVMEVELVEPFLFLGSAAHAPDRCAAAIAAHLARASL